MAREIGILDILANAFVYALETYAGLGLVFGVLFVCLGVQRLDPEARGLLILGRMKFANVAFEYNRRRTFEGTIEARPPRDWWRGREKSDRKKEAHVSFRAQ
jgi:hypothetical protein